MIRSSIKMSPSVHVGASPVTGSSERTPLLAPPSPQEEPVPIEDEDILAAQEIGEGGQEVPQFPYLGKTISRIEAEHIVKFQENGLLEGVPTWQFRCVFGGILMGYFVSPRCKIKIRKPDLNIDSRDTDGQRLPCSIPH